MVVQGRRSNAGTKKREARAKFCFANLKPGPHQSGHFQNHIFFNRIHVTGGLNHSGKRFKEDAVSVSGFTGFTWT